MSIVPLFGIVLGAVSIGTSIRVITVGQRLRRHGMRVPGVVVGLRRSGNGVYYPTLQFQTVQGSVVKTESDLGFKPSPVRPGQQVMVVYDPERPQHVRLDGAGGRGGNSRRAVPDRRGGRPGGLPGLRGQLLAVRTGAGIVGIRSGR